jgi:hypothetical protein
MGGMPYVHLFCQQPFQLGVLILQRLPLANITRIHPTVLRPPLIKRRIADPVLAAQISS